MKRRVRRPAPFPLGRRTEPVNKSAFVTTADARAALIAAGRADGGDIVRLIAWACLTERLTASGVPHVSAGKSTNASYKRRIISSRLWRFFHRAFVSNQFHRSTMLEENWEYGEFRYQVERDADDERPPLEVTCFINWEVGMASFAFDDENGRHVQSVWRSILFDAPMLETLCRRIAPREKRSRATKYDWPSFMAEAMGLMRQRGTFNADWTQAECERLMSTWCFHKWGKEPAESTLRDRVKEAERAFMAQSQADLS